MLVILFFALLMARWLSAVLMVSRWCPKRSLFRQFKLASFIAFRPCMTAFACPQNYVTGCDFAQALVDETPKYSKKVMMDIRPIDGWLGNVATGSTEMGTPVEVTQDRFRSVTPNSAKQWNRTVANGTGCTGAPCDQPRHKIGYGADRLTFFSENIEYATDLFCYNQLMHITHAREHLAQIVSKILKPATTRISSTYLRKRHLYWSFTKWAASGPNLLGFTYQWSLGGPLLDEEMYFDCSVSPAMFYKLAPQMLMHRYSYLMKRGYAGENPFKETAPYIELVADMDIIWDLEHLGGQLGTGGGDSPNVLGNWRFQNFDQTGKYWKYGFSGAISNYMVRDDEFGMRFNYVGDMGAAWNGGNGNRYRYQWVEPYLNSITTGAGGSAGIGDDVNPAFEHALYRIIQIHHKKGMTLLVPDTTPINPEMPFIVPKLGGAWTFAMDNLGADVNGVAIDNSWGNKGRFQSRFEYMIEPGHYEFLESILCKAEKPVIPLINPAATDPGYPAQNYDSELPLCPQTGWPAPLWAGDYPPGFGVPTGTQDGPVPQPPTPIPQGSADY